MKCFISGCLGTHITTISHVAIEFNTYAVATRIVMIFCVAKGISWLSRFLSYRYSENAKI